MTAAHRRKGSVSVTVSSSSTLLSLSSQVVSAYLRHNRVSTDDLPALILNIRDALSTVDVPDPPEEPPLVPAVPPKRSVQKDHIVCLDCGMKLSMLKRHLRTAHNMNAEEYKARWGLPGTYPLTAPSYAAQRSALAKQFGLGLKPAGDTGATQEDAGVSETPSAAMGAAIQDEPIETASSAAPKRRSRRGPQLRRRQARKS